MLALREADRRLNQGRSPTKTGIPQCDFEFGVCQGLLLPFWVGLTPLKLMAERFGKVPDLEDISCPFGRNSVRFLSEFSAFPCIFSAYSCIFLPEMNSWSSVLAGSQEKSCCRNSEAQVRVCVYCSHKDKYEVG